MRRAALFLALLGGLLLQAQDVVVYGRVREHEVMRPIAGAVLALSSNGVHQLNVVCDSTGYYKIALDVGRVWRIRYSAPGRVAKTVEMDLRTTPKDDGGYGMNVDIRLFMNEPAKDFSWLEEPIGISSYDSTSSSLKWDMDYTAPRLSRMREMVPEVYDTELNDSIPDPVPEE